MAGGDMIRVNIYQRAAVAVKRHDQGLRICAATAISSILASQSIAQSLPTATNSASASDPSAVSEIIVTAQKRKETANSVPMSITAATGDQLRAIGIDQPKDLVKITPGFSYADSYVGSPIYTLRGVGFSDISLGGRPTVSIYTDEAPIPFAIETRGANLDLERVEVLKGPQGTLFGQNATGGAINYIDAKPTDTFKAGIDASYGRFNAMDLGGFISGPVTDNLEARISVDHTQNDDWQRSYTSGATNGLGDFTTGRIILAWTPTAHFRAQLNVNGWVDRSDTQASQLLAVTPTSLAAAAVIPGLLSYPVSPMNARAADFNPGQNYRKNNSFFQINLRADYDINKSLTITSISSFSHYSEQQLQDIDGTSLSNLSELTDGKITSYSQELRLSGEIEDKIRFVVGGDFAADRVFQTNNTQFPQSTTALTFIPLGLPLFADFTNFGTQVEKTYAAFGNIEYRLTDSLKFTGGARYTQADNTFNGCSADSGDGIAASDFGPFQNFVRSQVGLPPNPPIARGGCITANSAFVPGLVTNTLNEDNVSWRVGVEWTPISRTLLYANVSKGYKAGGFPDLGATTATQYEPATQESILAYETGFKTTILDRTLQLNGAVFYYDYRNKQILGRVLDPLFGPLLKLINVPKSDITGAELQAVWAPLRGLTVSGGASYIDSRVLDNFSNYDSNGQIVNFGGEAFPNTPKWQLVSAVDYNWSLTDHLDAFVGANANYQSQTNSELGNVPLLALRAYTLVDLRAGVQSPDGTWRFWAWGRNVGNVYYWTAASRDTDTTTRFAGAPATYGVTLSYRFH
jgi:outer membrane receptor protein involved in Fe transport